MPCDYAALAQQAEGEWRRRYLVAAEVQRRRGVVVEPEGDDTDAEERMLRQWRRSPKRKRAWHGPKGGHR